jgi:hypothetical protein
MSRRRARILFAVVIGAIVTGVTAAVAVANSSESVRELVFWPNTLLQYLVPAPNIGTAEHPFYEGTPLAFLAFLVSFPFAVIVYSLVAYAFLRRLKT